MNLGTRTYLVDGLHLRVESEPFDPLAWPAAPDWSVVFEGAPGGEDSPQTSWVAQVKEGGAVWAHHGRIGRSHRIRLDGVLDLLADPCARRAVIRAETSGPDQDYLLRRAAPYLATASGLLALHASAVAFPAGAVLFAGSSGAGKSSLSVAFDVAGTPPIADDHVVIRFPSGGTATAAISFPFCEIWEDTRAALRPEASPGAGKTRLPWKTMQPSRPTPVRAVAFLDRGERIAWEPMAPVPALAALLKDSAYFLNPHDPSETRTRIESLARLLECAPAVRLTVPRTFERLRESLAEIARPWGGLQSARSMSSPHGRQLP